MNNKTFYPTYKERVVKYGGKLGLCGIYYCGNCKHSIVVVCNTDPKLAECAKEYNFCHHCGNGISWDVNLWR